MTTTYFPTTLGQDELDTLTSYVRHEFSKGLIDDGFKLGMHPFRAYYCDGCNADVGQPCSGLARRDWNFGHNTGTGTEYFCRQRTVNFDYHPSEYRHLDRDRVRFVRAVREVERSKDRTNFIRLRLVREYCECGDLVSAHPTWYCDATEWE